MATAQEPLLSSENTNCNKQQIQDANNVVKKVDSEDSVRTVATAQETQVGSKKTTCNEEQVQDADSVLSKSESKVSVRTVATAQETQVNSKETYCNEEQVQDAYSVFSKGEPEVSIRTVATAQETQTGSKETNCNEEQVQDMNNVLSKPGSEGPAETVCRDLKRSLDAWKDVEVNIGVIGASGVGKSTLINNLRRLHPEQEGAAPVGPVETTLEPKPYSYPNNPSMKLWDLPGVGTQEFPRAHYLSLIHFEKYDFFLIVCATRFTENDHWFACEVQKAGKQFYLVRTKIDFDIANEQEDYPETFNKEKFLIKIRKDCTSSLKKENFGDLFVALVGKKADAFEFHKLEEKMICDRGHLQREVVLFTMHTSAQIVIKEKSALLLRRVDKIAVYARVVAIVPLISPLLSATLIYNELILYKNVFGLNDERLNQISEHARVSKEDIARAMGQHFWSDLTFEKVLNEMTQFTNHSFSDRSYFKNLLSAFRFAHSFEATPWFLRTCIESMEPAATNILSKFLSNN